ncbi:uncharacterized protein SETTUDRAFT_156607 [Exserohilum turcica Et28A]|uniref:Uncharacterized protein n=1 Tax=Exserohilum turcicum (strain 28A) TaxID=671987 RepID=R0ICM6_EXST2|nr:uncharacterized protein SETTUDRAFT_156607 [Exserohilum turcica Et28A]EOA82951.1 hypothetical protein SETTUDRAFT_156607 [Exserohilum turcica Et28A]
MQRADLPTEEKALEGGSAWDGAEEAPAGKKPKKGKKGQEEPKQEFDLNAALPKADDFRTSLILPGLSTRFSMLREQDDPSSLIGKASDDSVLQPKRQSRLHEFGFNPSGLGDIAEVSSLSSSVRPFANERTNSFDSGSRDEDNSSSIMTRARPGEGNILFGGRQKIFVISNSNSKGTGRTLYDDDVNMSAYQRLRQEEKERLRREAEDEDEFQHEDDGNHHSEPSSPSEVSRKRETTSSTNSGPVNTRTSTAATSIASQGANSIPASSPALPPSSAPMGSPDLSRSTTTTKRRLYDQGLDQQIQDQQSSAMSRLNSIQRARAPTGRSTPPAGMAHARSATNLHDRFARGPGFRSDSPNSFSGPGMTRTNSSDATSPVLSRPQSPPLISPVISEDSDAYSLNAALQPTDRGKATAMGAFNKPKEAFSEEQYAERLRQMNQDRQARESPAPGSENPSARKPTLRERAEQEKRKRAASEAKETHKPESAAEPSPATHAFSRFQAAASQMRTAGAALASPPSQQREKGQDDCAKATFLASATSSDDEQAEEEAPRPTATRPAGSARRFDNLPVATGPAPPMFEHPALRARAPSDDQAQLSGFAAHTLSPSLRADLQPPKPSGLDSNAPTLGPNNGGLSGLIRQHLRNVSNVSNVSSAYGEAGPPLMSPPMASANNDFGLQRRQPESEAGTRAPSTYTHSNPWDLDDIDNPYRDTEPANPSSPIEGSTRIRPLIMSTSEQPRSKNGSAAWDLTPRRNHERIASNETEAEHEAFQRDLAQRQRFIQENLRARAEGRSTSPGPGAGPGSSGGLKNALSMLRAKSSGESFATVEAPNKSVRKLALGGAAGNASSTSLAEMPPLRSKPSRVLQQSEQDAQRELDQRQRSATDSSRTGRPTGRSPPVSTRSSTRERSSSGTSSGRSRSRGDHYRDDLDQAMSEGTRSAYPANTLPSLPGYVAHATPPLPAPKSSMESTRSRSRSNSKASAANHFESKHLFPIQTNLGAGQNSRFTPGQGKVSPGLPMSPRPSPGAYSNNEQGYPHPNSPMPPFATSHTPPVSNPTTPNITAFNPSTVQPLTRQGVLRKKSVAKADISEPVFLSTTSVIDLVDLPAGASLKNGSEPEAPPVPPINPMRRRFGLGRGDSHGSDPAVQPGIGEPVRTGSADIAKEAAYSPPPRNMLRKATSEGRSLRGAAQSQLRPSAPMPHDEGQGRNHSPPRSGRPVEGAMF